MLIFYFRYYDVLRDSLIIEEKWNVISTIMFQRSLVCAMKLKQTEDIIRLSLKLCELSIPLPFSDKKYTQDQLLQSLYQDHELDLPSLNEPIQFVNNVPEYPLISASCQFDKEQIRTNMDVVYRIRLVSSFPMPIRFGKLVVSLTNSYYDVNITDHGDPFYVGNSETSESLLLHPGVPKVFEFTKKATEQCDIAVSYFTHLN